MKKIRILSVVFLLGVIFLCPCLTGQNSTINFNLEQYKLPFLKRHILEFDLNLSGSNYLNKIENEDEEQYRYLRNTYSAGLIPRYYFFYNSEKLQLWHNLTLDIPNFYSNNTESTGYKSKNHQLYPAINYNAELREYLSGKFFVEQDPAINIAHRNYTYEYTNLDQNGEISYSNMDESVTLNVSAGLRLLAGWGRIEPVEDARLAVYILADLKKAGYLAREPENQDIIRLAERISEVRNERFFDSRHKTIWEMQQIDSLLKTMGIIAEDNISYFNILRDNWDYASGPSRSSGFRISGGILPEIVYTDQDVSEETRYTDPDTTYSNKYVNSERAFRGNILGRVEYQKPLNLYWQLSLSNELRFSRNSIRNTLTQDDDSENEEVTEYIEPGVQNRFAFSIGYYPNTRTSLFMYTTETLQYMNSKQEDLDDLKTTGFSTSSGIELNYYISPQLRLRLDTYFEWTNNKYRERSTGQDRNHDINVSLGITYMLL